MQPELALSKKPDASPQLASYHLADNAGTKRREDASLTVTDTEPVGRPLDAVWITHLQGICEKQDRQAFAALFQHFAPRVKAFLIKSGASSSLAEDCVQDVMTTVWQKAHLFDPTRASVATWIFTIARNRRIDLLRKDRRPEPEELPWGPEPEPDQADVLAQRQDSEKLRHALAKLPDKQRELVERCYFGDLSHNEIATETGLPLGTIKSRIRLALEKLRHEMN